MDAVIYFPISSIAAQYKTFIFEIPTSDYGREILFWI